MPVKLDSKEKKGKSVSERKELLKKKRAIEHQKFLRGFLNDSPKEEIVESVSTSEKPVKKKKEYKNPQKVARVAAAEIREKAASERSPEEQIKNLNLRLGDNVGAQKERAKINKKIENALALKKKEPVKESEKQKEVVEKPKLKAKERRAKEQKNK